MTTEGEAQTLAEEAGSQPPHKTKKKHKPSRVAPDPKALRDWKWSTDPDTRNNVCPNGLRYINLSKGDIIWTGRCPGTPPTPTGRRHPMALRLKQPDGKVRMVPVHLRDETR